VNATREIIEVEQAIINLTRALGGDASAEAVGPEFEKWWLVAVGDAFDEASFEQREAARERLRRFLHARGVKMPEWVWVYDEESRAKVILAQCLSGEEAERLAGIYRAKGIIVRIRHEPAEEGTAGNEAGGAPEPQGEGGTEPDAKD